MKKSFVIIFASLLMTSCATIFTGTKDKITFNSIPVGATVYKGGVEQCQTPCSINMQRSVGNTDIEYKLNGYETRLITLEKNSILLVILIYSIWRVGLLMQYRDL